MKDISISSTIEEKITWADNCCKAFGSLFLKDSKVITLLNEIKIAIQNSHLEMVKTGIVALCMECEQDEGGSCCGAGIENRYGGRLLLINRILGVDLPKTRSDSKSCFFLGTQGCCLQARHVICINYMCKKISGRIEPGKINALREIEGKELHFLFLLHERLKKIMMK